MFTFPDEFLAIIIRYAALFSKPVFTHAKLLLARAILAPGKRTICSVLRIAGLGKEQKHQKYHRVLSLTKWSCLKGARILLHQLLDCFLADGPVVLGIDEIGIDEIGIDETLERRWESKIKKRGIYPCVPPVSHLLREIPGKGIYAAFVLAVQTR